MKDSKIVGILVGNLAKSNVELVDHLKLLIKNAGKRPYVLAVGRINSAKLANFPEIQTFVLISCPFHALIFDCSDFFQPILTPFEAELALNPRRNWAEITSGWVSDYNQLLTGEKNVDKSQEFLGESKPTFL